MLFGRPIPVWILAAFLGIPAVFYVVAHVLVLAGVVSPPTNLREHFEHLDRMTFVINAAESILLVVCVAFLLAMRRISLPLFALSFAIDVIHTLSGRYLDERPTPQTWIVTVVMGVVVLGYVWHLQRRNLLR